MITVRDAFALAFAHEAAGRFGEARQVYAQILAALPDHPGALMKLAQCEQRDGDVVAAAALLRRALRAAEAQSLPAGDLWMALGRLELGQGDHAAARRSFERARDLGVATADVAALLAWLALERGDAAEALALSQRGLDSHPGDRELLAQLGRALRACGRLPEACAALRAAVAAAPDDPRVRVWLGAACLDLGLAREARDHFEQAIRAGQNTAEDWDNLGLALLQLGELGDAAAAFERAVALAPMLTPALSNLLNAQRLACRWDDAAPREREWLAGIDDAGRDPRWNPFLALALETTPAQQLRIARSWSARVLPRVDAPAVITARGERLRVAYFSSDFRVHPMSMLIAGHFERHDRRRFEVFGYSHGPDDDSAIRRRVAAAFEHWVDVRAMGDLQVGERMRADRIDVLVELNGHTQGQRLGVLSHRPAPVQLHYLGFPGTLGFDGIDGIIADAVVAPPGEDHHFHERVLRLPRCYFVNDSGRALPPAASRASLGIADGALLLASFNQAYKLTRKYFGVWMEVLRAVPDALLWLYVPAPLAQASLKAEAERHGVDAARILFASKVPQDEHVARLRAADLSLDVAPYNSHTTGCDSLWAGVPMLTCKGTTFAGRVGESLVGAAGQPELVAASFEDYRATLFALAADRGRLRHHREHLEREKRRMPLFDTDGFTRDFETLLVAAFETMAAGRATTR
jgi:protein O-GlcNAc transferase